jgi:predicted nucleic acid-binding Zn ribbon protein
MRAKYLKTGKKSQPQEISEILGKVIESAAVGVDVRQAELIGRWSELVPPDWVPAAPVGVRDEVLLVEVRDGATASVLRYQVDPLLRAIIDEFGSGLVRSVRVTVARR